MQAIEVTIFFVFAALVGIMMIAFITGFDFASLQNVIVHILKGEEKLKDYEKVSYPVFLYKVYACWESCNFGKEDKLCGTFYIEPDQANYGKTIKQNELIADFKKYNICEECKVSITHPPLELPAIVKLGCDKKRGIVIDN